MKRIKMKIFFSFFCMYFLLNITITLAVLTESQGPPFSTSSGAGRTIYVFWNSTSGDGSREHPYQHIWQAVDAAQDGDTVYVFNGSYGHEIRYIDKSIHFIGENKNTTQLTTIDGSPVLTIRADHVNISGFMMTNQVNKISPVKLIIHANYCTISDIRFTIYPPGASFGDIMLFNASYTTIKNNIYSSMGGIIVPWPCTGPAIHLSHSCHNVIENGDFKLFFYGIGIKNESNDNIIRNNALDSRLSIVDSRSNTVTQNSLFMISIQNSSQINITNNNFGKYAFKMWREAGPQVLFSNSDIFFDHNYWGRPRLLPKVLFGYNETKRAIEVDWHPTKEPYQI